MNCQHLNIIKKGITTGKCESLEEGCGCTGYCQQPAGLQILICKDCGKEIYSEIKPIDCRSEIGITIGLIDSLIYISRILAKRDFNQFEVQEALKDLKSDEDLNYVLNYKIRN